MGGWQTFGLSLLPAPMQAYRVYLYNIVLKGMFACAVMLSFSPTIETYNAPADVPLLISLSVRIGCLRVYVLAEVKPSFYVFCKCILTPMTYEEYQSFKD
jgi:hypothetical protein